MVVRKDNVLGALLHANVCRTVLHDERRTARPSKLAALFLRFLRFLLFLLLRHGRVGNPGPSQSGADRGQ